jgi:hypothetical protein
MIRLNLVLKAIITAPWLPPLALPDAALWDMHSDRLFKFISLIAWSRTLNMKYRVYSVLSFSPKLSVLKCTIRKRHHDYENDGRLLHLGRPVHKRRKQ